MKYYLIILFLNIIIAKNYHLSDLIHIALEKSPQIKLANEDLKISLSHSIEARSSALPSIQFITSVTKNYNVAGQPIDFPIPFGVLNPETGAPIPTDWNPNLQQTEIIPFETMFSMGRDYSGVYGININQTIFDGRVFAGIRASNKFKKLTNASYDSQIEGIIENTKIYYYTVLLTKKVTEVFNKSLKRSQDNLVNTKLLYDSGKINELELIRAESLVKDQETTFSNAKKNEILAIEKLKLFVGLNFHKDITILGSFSDSIQEIPLFDEITNQFFAQQPRIKQLETNHDLLKEDVNSYISEFLPSIELSGSIHKFQSQNKDNFTWKNFQDNSSISINIGLPLFNGFGSTARIMRAKANAKKAYYHSEDLKNNLLLELRSIHLSLIEANEKINAGNKKLELASRGYNIANDLFLTGMTTQLELLGSEVSLNRAELNLLQAKYEFQIALAKLSRAIGNNTTGNTK
jgi:outer membrane protein TolC